MQVFVFLMIAVTVRQVVEYLCSLNQEARAKPFPHLQKWTYRFLIRRSLSIRRVSRRVTIEDNVLQTRLVMLLEEVSQIYFSQPNTVWINMDETGIQYEMIPRSTIDFVGAETIAIETEGSTSARVTLAVTICSTGEKLPLMAIFKGSTTGRIVREFANPYLEYPSTMEYSVQTSAWMDEQMMLHWINRY